MINEYQEFKLRSQTSWPEISLATFSPEICVHSPQLQHLLKICYLSFTTGLSRTIRRCALPSEKCFNSIKIALIGIRMHAVRSALYYDELLGGLGKRRNVDLILRKLIRAFAVCFFNNYGIIILLEVWFSPYHMHPKYRDFSSWLYLF